MTVHLNFNNLRSSAYEVANNRLLKEFEAAADSFTEKQYGIFSQNMRLWLAPTVVRLRRGLALIEKERSNQLTEIEDAFIHNIEDESGGGVAQYSHAHLFVKSSTLFHKVIYGTHVKSMGVIASTSRLNRESIRLFSNDLYEMLGACMAQELHALPQLELMYDGHRKLRDKFDNKDWRDVSEFYDIHLDGTEARHADDLNKTVWALLDDDQKVEKFNRGFTKFIQLLNDFWSDLDREIRLQNG